MKIVYSLFKINLFIISLLITSCSSREITYSAKAISFEADGYLKLEIWDFKKGQNYKPDEALKDAIYTVLYQGISSNNNFVAQKPLLLSIKDQEKFKTIEAEFFKETGDWSKFVRISSTQPPSTQNLNSEDVQVYQVSIAKDLLRKYLEEQKIIDPITTGF